MNEEKRAARRPVTRWIAIVAGLCAASAQAMDYTAVFTAPPKNVPSNKMVDGPLLGNGGVGVVLAGPPEEQQFWIGKNDFWRRNNAQPLPVGVIEIRCAELDGAPYRQEQSLARAEVRGDFGLVRTRTWMQATENVLVTAYTCAGSKPVTLSVRQIVGALGEQPQFGTLDPGLPGSVMVRQADKLPAHLPEVSSLDGPRVVATATRLLGGTVKDGGVQATLQPGETAWVVSAILSDLDVAGTTPDAPRGEGSALPAAGSAVAAAAKALAASADVAVLEKRHQDWWREFWSRSFIEIPDKVIEKHWYAALYTIASCSRAGQVAPGLWGNWTTSDRTMWHGDFHLNYNFEAPYYHVYAGNHVELSWPLEQAILEYMPFGREMARARGWKGVHYPIGIGPWGIAAYPRDKDLCQRSCAAYAALNFIWDYQYTQDTDRLRSTLYPYLREVAEFWEHYLAWEPFDSASASAGATADKQGGNGRYVIHNDAIHESHQTEDMNNLLSLGLVRFLFRNMLVMSAELGVDADKQDKWRHILEHLSAFPTQERNGKTVFRYTEKGMDWNRGNTLGIQHIFPAGAVGLDSDPRLLEISRNMIEAMGRWRDYNGFSSWYTASVRVGYDPDVILKNLRTVCERHAMPNLVVYFGGGGIEGCGGFQAVNEMLLQSHEGVLRFFPVWPKDLDARFGTLRARGAFLVSAELRGGEISGVRIVSEKGRDCTVQNPWPGRKVTLAGRETMEGERVTFKTGEGEVIVLNPG